MLFLTGCDAPALFAIPKNEPASLTVTKLSNRTEIVAYLILNGRIYRDT